MQYTPDQQRYLLVLARRAITTQLSGGAMSVAAPLDGLPPSEQAWLQQRRATFVTLYADQQLRGCIGSLEPQRTLAADIWHNARAAAFTDPRFAPVTESELSDLHIELSILSPLKPLEVSSRAELLERLRPGIDGLVVVEGARRATFLPSVWAQLPQPEGFVTQLWRKAGFAPDHWSDQLQFSYYQVQKFTE